MLRLWLKLPTLCRRLLGRQRPSLADAMLGRRRGDDINMRSAWLCSRNDVAANAGVLLAAAGVGLSGAAWPDIAIGLLIAGIFASSSIGVIRVARHQLRARRA